MALPVSAAYPAIPETADQASLKGLAADHRFDDPLLSVLIVNYCQWDETASLVRQLRQSLSARQGVVETLIVDNHSPSHPLARRLRRLPGVSLCRWRRNRGFARAVNEGTRLSRAPWLLLLNPDVSVGEHFLDDVLLLSERLTAREPGTGVVGLRLREETGELQRSAGPLPTFTRTLAGLLLPRRRRKYLQRELHNREEVPWVTGCGLLVRRDCLTQLGGLGEDFFLYYEDVDFCQRARAAGWSVWHEPSLELTHHRPLQNRAVSPHLRVLTRHALLTYAAKHWPRWQSWLLHGVVGLEARIRSLKAWLHRDLSAEATFTELAALATDLRRGQTVEARRRLNRLVRQEEARRVSESVDRHPQPQSVGPPPRVFANRVPVLAH